MADLSHDWLDAQLVRQLAPVKAPDSLWTRVQAERRERRNPARAVWILWPAVAMVLVLASIDLCRQIGKAAEAGARIESNKPAELRAWVNARANLTVAASCRTCHLDAHGQI
jgi:hypothetical protein